MGIKRRAELLSPCGNFDCVKAAVNNGADAVYLGGRLFNARAYASNFDDAELERVCDLCHSYQVKVYVTVNTLYKDGEFSSLIPFIDGLYAMGVDGLIMQDLGAVSLVRQCWPDFPVHASTQLTANCLDDVKAFEALGLTTAVLSRELNLKEIAHIAANTSLRIETFIHGALCVSYSGQCLMSSVLGNRSGNRGKCAQNCRLNYELLKGGQPVAEGHLLSTKDICTLGLLPKLLEAGVASLKIEGRMKSPEYVAGVTGIYRKYLDLACRGGSYEVEKADVLVLQQLFNRGAFSRGYLETHSGMEMMCPSHPKHWGVFAGKVLSYDQKKQSALLKLDKAMVPGDGIEIRTDDEEGAGTYLNKASDPGEKTRVNIRSAVRENQAVYQTYDKRLMDGLKLRYDTISRKVPIEAFITLHAGEPSSLVFRAGSDEVRAEGDVPLSAVSQPLTAETVSAQIGKLGSTIFAAEKIKADLDDGLYLNKSSLNTLKNAAAEMLRERMISRRKRKPLHPVSAPLSAGEPSGSRSLSVCVRTGGQFDAAAACGAAGLICMEMNEELMADPESFVNAAHKLNKKVMVKLPRIFREYVQENTAAVLERCRKSGADGFLISNLGHYHAVKDLGKEIALDFTGNVLNSRSCDFWKALGVSQIAVSVEMSREEINALADRSGIEVLAYGHLPLMVTHQCPVGNFAGKKMKGMHCEKFGSGSDYTLRSGKDRFRLDTDCRNCICTIETEAPIDIRKNINSFKVSTFRINFSDENYAEAKEILRKYETLLKSGKVPSRQLPDIYDKSVL